VTRLVRVEEGSRCDTGAAPATVTGYETGISHCAVAIVSSLLADGGPSGKARE